MKSRRFSWLRRQSHASFTCMPSCTGGGTIFTRPWPSFLAKRCALSWPTRSKSIHRMISFSGSSSGSSRTGSDVAPLGSEMAGMPVAWYTAIASYSPSVITRLSQSVGTVCHPKKPQSPPFGSRRMWLFVSIDRILYRCTVGCRCASSVIHGNTTQSSARLSPLSRMNVFWHAPTQYLRSVSSVSHRPVGVRSVSALHTFGNTLLRRFAVYSFIALNANWCTCVAFSSALFALRITANTASASSPAASARSSSVVTSPRSRRITSPLARKKHAVPPSAPSAS